MPIINLLYNGELFENLMVESVRQEPVPAVEARGDHYSRTLFKARPATNAEVEAVANARPWERAVVQLDATACLWSHYRRCCPPRWDEAAPLPLLVRLLLVTRRSLEQHLETVAALHKQRQAAGTPEADVPGMGMNRYLPGFAARLTVARTQIDAARVQLQAEPDAARRQKLRGQLLDLEGFREEMLGHLADTYAEKSKP